MMPCAMTMSVQVCEAIAKTGMPVAAVQAMVPQPPLRKRERARERAPCSCTARTVLPTHIALRC